MDEMEQKINAILGNPQMMSQLMSMAQALSGPQQESAAAEPAPAPPKPTALPAGIDLNMMQKVAGIAQRTGIDRNQQQLLKALSPYLCKERITKLEKAMRAAKIASLATSFLGSGSSLLNPGR
ncbi:MAG: hypothetical protein IJF02_02360 [Oscillospiraceae bacterium]|nr:hypothetical protein [Oscillospiraceae bacterium]